MENAIKIREIVETDAPSLMKLRKQLFTETQFMLLEPDEYRPTIESESNFITSFQKSPNSILLLAENQES